MMINKKVLIPLSIVLGVAAALLMGWLIYQFESAENRMEYATSDVYGRRMTDFVLEDTNEQQVSVAASSGKPKLIHFWASWCPYCQAETKDLNRIYDAYKGEIEFLSVNITTDDSEEDVYDFIETHDVQMPVLFDRDGEVTAQYQVSAIPTSFLIMGDGTIHTITYAITEKDIKPHLEELLAAG
jgi:peroxiredoxin